MKKRLEGLLMGAGNLVFFGDNPIEQYHDHVSVGYLDEASKYMKRGNYEQALQRYIKHAERSGCRGEAIMKSAHWCRGRDFSNKGMKQEACNDYEISLQYDNDVESMKNTIRSLLNLLEGEELIVKCRKYLGKSPLCYYYLGNYHAEKNEYQTAIENYLQYLNDPGLLEIDKIRGLSKYIICLAKLEKFNEVKIYIDKTFLLIEPFLKTEANNSPLKSEVCQIKENLQILTQNNEKERPLWIVNKFKAVLDQTEKLTIELIEEMFKNTKNVVEFKFPYTLANILKTNKPDFANKINEAIINSLEDLATNHIKGPEFYAIFVDIILASVMNHGIITSLEKTKLAKKANNTEIFNSPEFQELKEKVSIIEAQVKRNTQNIYLLSQSMDKLAQHVSQLQRAFKKKAEMECYFGIASVALSLVGGQVFDLVLAHVADLSSGIEVGAALLELPLNMPEKEIMATLTHYESAITHTTIAQGLRLAGLDPDKFLDDWAKTTLALHNITNQNSPVSVQRHNPVTPVLNNKEITKSLHQLQEPKKQNSWAQHSSVILNASQTVHKMGGSPIHSSISINTIEGIHYRKSNGNIINHYIELDFDDLKLGRAKSNQLREFIKRQIQDLDGYIENSYNVSEDGIVSIAFSREKAAKNFQALLQEQILYLKSVSSFVLKPESYKKI